MENAQFRKRWKKAFGMSSPLHATGITTGVEDTIVSYNIMFNTGKGGEV